MFHSTSPYAGGNFKSQMAQIQYVGEVPLVPSPHKKSLVKSDVHVKVS